MANDPTDTEATTGRATGGGGSRNSITPALRDAKAAPENDEAWDNLEELAATLNRPDEVSALYVEVLRDKIPRKLVAKLGQRAVRFHEEWFGESSSALIDILDRVLQIDPTQEWALARLTVAYTVAERWDDLLSVYDRALAATRAADKRLRLLEEASNIAKDFAGQADRAIGYLQQLLPHRLADSQLASSLERLLERQGRWRELVDIWSSRIPVLTPDQADETRARIATCWLDHLDDPGAALRETETLLGQTTNDTEAKRLLERLLALESAPADVRRRSLELLRARYEPAGRADDIVRGLRVALTFADKKEAIALHREAAQRLAGEGRDADAMEHYIALLALDPFADDVLEQLRILAARTNGYDRFALGLVAAADGSADPARTVSLLLEAAATRRDAVKDTPGAITLYQRVLSMDGAVDGTRLVAARSVSTLLEEAGRLQERLDVLERLATLEPEIYERRVAHGAAARLAEQLGDAERAIHSWQRRLDSDPTDLEALEFRTRLLDREQRWEALITTLRMRVEAPVTDVQRRGDLIRIARVQASQLGDNDKAIATWTEVRDKFGEDSDVVDALADLYATTNRFGELAELLARAWSRDTARVVGLLCRLGDAYREKLGQPERAVSCYADGLIRDPASEPARSGMHALLDVDATRPRAVDALVGAYARTDDWELTLTLLEHRLAAAKTPADKARILREAAHTHEQRAGSLGSALTALKRALAIEPDDESLERELARVAETTGEWARAVDAYRDAAKATSNSLRAAHLRYQEGLALEQRLGDVKQALGAYSEAMRLAPDRADALEAVVRTAARAGEWDTAARAIVNGAAARGRVDATHVALYEAAANESGAWDSAARSLTLAVAGVPQLSTPILRELETKIAGWHREKRNDVEEAEAALTRALAREGGTLETLRSRAELQRLRPGRPLVETLGMIAELTPADLDPLYEASDVALRHLEDRQLAITMLSRLLDEASRVWRRGSPVRGQRSPEEASAWALDELVRLHGAAGDHTRAAAILVEGSQLPFSPKGSQALRHRAAAIFAGELRDGKRAADIYRGIIAEAPEDLDAVQRLAALCEAEDNLGELLALRRHELGLTADAERRLALRLDIARLVGAVEERGGRLEALRKNLEELPGHVATVDAAVAVLESQGRHAEVVDLLADQAKKLESRKDAPRAAQLWGRAAVTAETALSDTERAIDAYRRVVVLAPNAQALESLARLHTARGEHATAAQWLDQRLTTTDESTWGPTLIRLAESHLAAGNRQRAIGTLETGFQKQPGSPEIRDLLAGFYREDQAWEPLANLLTKACAHVQDAQTELAFAREAAEIYRDRLNAPDQAIPVLERARALLPSDRPVQRMLAEGLRVAGRNDEARELLEQIVRDFGRRRSAERAQIHFQLAQVAQAQGDTGRAITELDLASSMDTHHTGLLKMLGELSRAAGELDRAERAYRALLLVLRHPRKGEEAPAVASSEVLYELHRIAKERGEDDKATELLESAITSASQNEADLRLLKAALLARNEPELVVRVLETRVASVQDPRAQAEALADLAELYDKLGREHEALDAALRALDLAPDVRSLHERARVVAANVGASQKYADALTAAVERLRRKEESTMAAQLSLRLGEVLEKDLGQLEAARDAYRRAEEMGGVSIDALASLARIAGTLGDSAEQMRALQDLLKMDSDEWPAEARADALYRLAEVELAWPDTRDQGIDTLVRAMERSPQYDRAAEILRKVGEDGVDDPRVLALYEKIARASGDARMLLQLAEHRTTLRDATLDHVRAAVDLADKIGEAARAERLLERAIELAKPPRGPGLEQAVWALIGLVERRKAASDLKGAMKWMRQAAEVTAPEQASALWLELAELAAGDGRDLELAAQMYEKLLEREPTDRKVWEPLLAVYTKLKDHKRLRKLVSSTLENLGTADERNALRLGLAKFLLDVARRRDDAVSVLRDIVAEDPGHEEATGLLVDLYGKTGNEEGLVELLARQLDVSYERKDVDAVARTSLRMGTMLQKKKPEEAKDVYRRALKVAPDDAGLLRALLELLGAKAEPGERADLMERVIANETGEKAASLAVELAGIRESLDDEAGVERALELGYRASPTNDTVRGLLEQWYRSHQVWPRLAEMLVAEAERATKTPAAVKLYREAATIHRETLGDPATAGQILRKAREKAPDDADLFADMMASLAKSGQTQEAIDEISASLERGGAKKNRLELLRLRSELRMTTGDDQGALSDLEAAFKIDRGAMADHLASGLEQQRAKAAERNDRETERSATLRLVEVLSEKDTQRARDTLDGWVKREPRDRDALRLLRDMDKAASNWDAVIATCNALLAVEEGEDRIEAALELASAAEQAGRPGDALAGLEQVRREAPSDDRIRMILRRIYEAAGAHRQLAELLLDEAGTTADENVKFEALRGAGEMLTASGDPVGALAALEQAIALRANDLPTVVALVDAYTRGERFEEAGQLLQTQMTQYGTRRSPELALLQHRMARLAQAAGDPRTQMEWLDVALDSDKNSGPIASELAELAMELGELDIAMKALRAITMMKSPGPMTRAQAFLRQAVIAHNKGDTRRAVLWARKAKEEDPALEEANEFLKRIKE